jgi:murein DD-endopeptidase MepM/ murein hydrolase activator NlpD
VKAPAGGIVTLAEELHIYGNAVIVKHGPRVSSSYNHLSTIGVAVGDVVEAGDVVGEVGSTGQSTGPHLHWGMVVGGVAVDAEQWSDRDFDAPLPGDFDGE